ncbi:unnamed protein product, partial [Sphagnum compactum]
VYQMLKSMNYIYKNEGIVRMWVGLKPIIVLFSPETVEVVLSSTTLTDKSVEYKFLEPWLGGGLVTSSRSKWKTRRKILTPAFHFRILEDFLPIINEQSTILIDKLRSINAKKTDVDIVPIITLCTLDVICETAMGIKVGCQANSELDYVKSLHNISGIFLVRLIRPWLWPNWAFNLSKHGKQFNSFIGINYYFKSRISQRSKSVKRTNGFDKRFRLFQLWKKRLAFLDLLLQQHLIANTLTLEDLREEVDTFMFAGHDTTAQAISWTLYMLGLHQDIQTRVREEVDSIFDTHPDSDDFTVEDIKQLKYLDCVLKEVQRLYPTAPFIGRELSEDTII